MELMFPIFGSVPDEHGNVKVVPIHYYNYNDYINEFGINPFTVKPAVTNSRWVRK